MRRAGLWAVGMAAVGCGSCGGEVAAATVGQDTLVLEVGGERESLRRALVALGRDVPPPRWLIERAPQMPPGPVAQNPPMQNPPQNPPMGGGAGGRSRCRWSTPRRSTR